MLPTRRGIQDYIKSKNGILTGADIEMISKALDRIEKSIAPQAVKDWAVETKVKRLDQWLGGNDNAKK